MSKLIIHPLGGLGEIGSNATIIETSNYNVVIDFGMLFPKDRFFEINYLSINPEVLNLDKPFILFITHGHEDHIGAISQLIKFYKPEKVYASNFTKNLIHHKLKQYNQSIKIETYTEDSVLAVDDIELNPVHVTHSIPETFGVIISHKTTGTNILFISDFKFDLNPLYEKPFNYQKIQNIFKGSKKNIAMLDSTNILNPGKTLSESALSTDLENIISQERRKFFTLFSSNVYRLKNILELSKKHNQKVVLIGRSIHKYLNIAEESKLLKLKDYPIREIEEVKNIESDNLVFILTGCQGEFKGATRRIVNGDHKQIKLKQGDLYIFSSKVIPGNEKEVYDLYNKLSEQNVEIISHREAKVHASGHPGREDLKELINLINPTHYIPIHGESYFLEKHSLWIKETFPDIDCIKLHNHDSLNAITLKAEQNRKPDDGLLLIQANNEPIEKAAISKRRKIAQNGACFISISSIDDISISLIGLPDSLDDELKRIERLIVQVLSDSKVKDYSEEIRIKIRQFFKSKLDYRPITYVHLHKD